MIEDLVKYTTNKVIEENAEDVRLYYTHISPDHEVSPI